MYVTGFDFPLYWFVSSLKEEVVYQTSTFIEGGFFGPSKNLHWTLENNIME